MATTAEGRNKAAHYILRMTQLGEHPLVAPHINIDASPTTWDWEAVTEQHLSSGEHIAIGVLKVIVLGHGPVRVDDLYHVDDHYRAVLIDALRMALVGDAEAVLV